MDKVIPILPCPDIKVQVEFYQQLGFEIIDLYTSPNPYAAMQFGAIELHFYGSRKMVPAENATMCFVKVGDVDSVYNVFTSNLKKYKVKVPRSGIPRISKIRDLSNDRRFTLTDTGGNTFYIGTPVKAVSDNFFRTLQNQECVKKFNVLYDLVYSKEDCLLGANMLTKLLVSKDLLNDLDKAKLLLVGLEIQRQLGYPKDNMELKTLFETHMNDGEDWEKVRKRYHSIRSD